MSTKSVIIIIFTILLVGLLSFVGVWTYKNWDKLKMAFDGTKIYTHEDLVNAKEDGYNEALEDQKHYLDLINEYQSKIDALTIQKEQLIKENEELFKNNNFLTIENNELSRLVDQYVNQIEQLQLKIDYYIQLLSQYDTENTAMVTFEFNGIAHDAQIVQIGKTTTVINPESSDYVKFNYWTVNGERVDLSTYVIQEDTTFVADCTYYYDVLFYVDSEVFNSQIVIENGFASIPNEPIKDGYRFLGWSLDNINTINISNVNITETTTFKAIFEKVYLIQYISDNAVIYSEYLSVNETPTYTTIPTKDRCIFLGWSIDKENIIDLETIAVKENLNVYAMYEYDRNGSYTLITRDKSGADILRILFVISDHSTMPDKYDKVLSTLEYSKNTSIKLIQKLDVLTLSQSQLYGVGYDDVPAYEYRYSLQFDYKTGEWNVTLTSDTSVDVSTLNSFVVYNG